MILLDLIASNNANIQLRSTNIIHVEIINGLTLLDSREAIGIPGNLELGHAYPGNYIGMNRLRA